MYLWLRIISSYSQISNISNDPNEVKTRSQKYILTFLLPSLLQVLCNPLFPSLINLSSTTRWNPNIRSPVTSLKEISIAPTESVHPLNCVFKCLASEWIASFDTFLSRVSREMLFKDVKVWKGLSSVPLYFPSFRPVHPSKGLSLTPSSPRPNLSCCKHSKTI